MNRKSTFLILITLLSGILSCRKDGTGSGQLTPDMLVGKWEIRKQIGGFSPLNDFPPGNGFIMEFTSTKVKNYAQGAMIQESSYTLHLEATSSADCPGQLPEREMERLLLDPDPSSTREFISIENARLVIRSTCVIPDKPNYLEFEKVK